MRRAILLPVVVFGLMAALTLPQSSAQAQVSCLTHHPGYPGFTPHPDDCAGAFGGNEDEAAVYSQIVAEGWGTDWTYQGKTGETTDPFKATAFQTNDGTLEFKAPFTGNFVLVLKAANFWSMYLYQGVTGLTSLDFVTDGVAVNPGNGTPQALSHATLFTQGTNVVPEPSTIILLGTGLLGLGLVGYKRRNQA